MILRFLTFTILLLLLLFLGMEFKALSKLSSWLISNVYPQPLVYDTKYHYGVQTGLRFIIFLPRPPKFCNYRWVQLHLALTLYKKWKLEKFYSLQTNALNYFLKQSEENETSEASDTYYDTIENSQIMDVPISGWMDEWNVVNIYCTLLFILS